MSDAYAAAVVVAAGKGERFGSGGKVLAESCGRPLLAWSLDALEQAASVRDVVIVYGVHTERAIQDLVTAGPWSKVIQLVEGGANRQESVVAGVRALGSEIEVVLIHDAARPLVRPDQFDEVAAAARHSGAAILAALIPDTLKRVVGGVITDTVSREGMWAAQTPQGFRLVEYLDAIDQIAESDAIFTDDASIYESLGRPVSIVAGSRSNMKVTLFEDLELVDLLLHARLRSSSSIGEEIP